MSSYPASRVRTTSSAWKYFKQISPEFVEGTKCKQQLKYCKNTSNMLSHLKRKHLGLWESTSTAKNNDSASTSKCESKIQQKKILKDFKGVTLSLAEQSSIDESLLKIIVMDCRPLKIVEDKGFLEYTRKLNPLYIPPSRKQLSTKLLDKKYEEAAKLIRNILSSVSYVSITTDIWTSSKNEPR